MEGNRGMKCFPTQSRRKKCCSRRQPIVMRFRLETLSNVVTRRKRRPKTACLSLWVQHHVQENLFIKAQAINSKEMSGKDCKMQVIKEATRCRRDSDEMMILWTIIDLLHVENGIGEENGSIDEVGCTLFLQSETILFMTWKTRYWNQRKTKRHETFSKCIRLSSEG